MTGEEMFDELCRKAGLPTVAEDLAAAHSRMVEQMLARAEQTPSFEISILEG